MQTVRLNPPSAPATSGTCAVGVHCSCRCYVHKRSAAQQATAVISTWLCLALSALRRLSSTAHRLFASQVSWPPCSSMA
jgi:hypothetical protein